MADITYYREDFENPYSGEGDDVAAELTPQTIEAAAFVAEVYRHSAVGGNLHCEVDDCNLEDRFFEKDFNPYDSNVSKEQLAAEKACYEVLRNLSEHQRQSAVAIEGLFYAAFNNQSPRHQKQENPND